MINNIPFYLDEERILLCKCNGITTSKINRANTSPQKYDSYVWKIFLLNPKTGETTKIPTKIPEDHVEYNPCAFKQGDEWIITFVSGGQTETRLAIYYNVYYIKTKDWITFTDPQELIAKPCRVGFGNTMFVCMDNCYDINKEEYDLRIRNKINNNICYIKTSFYLFLNAKYLSEDHSKLLFTGYIDDNKSAKTILFNTKNKEILEVVCNNESIYEGSIFEDKVIYAVKNGKNFDHRTLSHGTVNYINTEISVSMKGNLW